LSNGQSALCLYPDGTALKRLILAILGLTEQAEAQGEIFFRGQALGKNWNYYQRLDFFRRIGWLSSDKKLLSNLTLAQNICFELEYNQGLTAQQSLTISRERLEELGLERLATLDWPSLVGAERWQALAAFITCRRPDLFIIERPLWLLKEKFFKSWWLVLARELKDFGRGLLAFDRGSNGYPEGSFELIVDLNLKSSPKRSK
jgi:ABC-type transporter Mla maintaining outer membrane lipid asymmetry ATPase subunit MlaF